MTTRQYIFGLGTGRCGTTSLAAMLSMQEGCTITHEREHVNRSDEGGVTRQGQISPPLPWKVDEGMFERYARQIEAIDDYDKPFVNANREGMWGTCAIYYDKGLLQQLADHVLTVFRHDLPIDQLTDPWCARSYVRYAMPRAVVQHVGAKTTKQEETNRSSYWCAPSFEYPLIYDHRNKERRR